ncbi:hypothetical protein BD289DRAFT_186345 [Coniella lustricola]|uniref:Uncharacterized protein n=1 Tax=Coniella lustricola TaxID=2025994 RepID=A0A2T3AD09_9PEZI|nr:hypothetical protein BD289DRAFT_186345 [Coniella lustricola]
MHTHKHTHASSVRYCVCGSVLGASSMAFHAALCYQARTSLSRGAWLGLPCNAQGVRDMLSDRPRGNSPVARPHVGFCAQLLGSFRKVRRLLSIYLATTRQVEYCSSCIVFSIFVLQLDMYITYSLWFVA